MPMCENVNYYVPRCSLRCLVYKMFIYLHYVTKWKDVLVYLVSEWKLLTKWEMRFHRLYEQPSFLLITTSI